MLNFFVTKFSDPEYGTYYEMTAAGYIAVVFLLIAVFGTICFFASKGQASKKIKTKQMVFSGVSVALATVISVVLKLPSLPNGGSITLFSMLVVCLIGYWYGPKIGLLAGFSYGILQFITGPYIVHPAQVLLDFPLAFGALGLSGVFWKSKNGLLKGYILGVFGRFLFHMVSGLIFYTAYVGSIKGNFLAILSSAGYNLSYILPEAILTIVLLLLPPVKSLMGVLRKMACEE